MRRSFLVAVSCIALLFGQSSPADAAASFEYLARAANEITEIDHSTLTLTDQQNGRIAKIGCDALDQLLHDPQLNTALQGLLSSKESGKTQDQAYDLLTNDTKFSEEFLRTEEHALQAAGLNFSTTIDALAQAQMPRYRDVETLKDLTEARVRTTISQKRDAVCALKNHAISQEQGIYILRVILGTVLITADLVGTAATVELAAPLASASVAIGVSILENA
jgi:hypothetical protein